MQSILSQLLIKEHDVIKECGTLLLSQSKLCQSNPGEYENLINRITPFFTIYADEYHHCKEEDILFPEIQKKHVLAGNGIVQELLEQHEFFRDMMRSIKNAIAIKNYANVQLLFEEYINALMDHIAIENDELFPMLDSLFSKSELEKLYYYCVDQDMRLGSSRKAGFEDLIYKFQLNEPTE